MVKKSKSLFCSVRHLLRIALIFYNNVQILAVLDSLTKNGAFLNETKRNFVRSTEIVEIGSDVFDLKGYDINDGFEIKIYEDNINDLDFEALLGTPTGFLKLGFLGVKIDLRGKGFGLLLHSDVKTGSIVISELEAPETERGGIVEIKNNLKIVVKNPTFFQFELLKLNFVYFVNVFYFKYAFLVKRIKKSKFLKIYYFFNKYKNSNFCLKKL